MGRCSVVGDTDVTASQNDQRYIDGDHTDGIILDVYSFLSDEIQFVWG